MGALNEHRLREFLDRFDTFEENVTSGIPAFMYGSHYSTMVGVVLHFLVRLQPFAALHKEMQNGHFDVSDRLFSSIPRSFRHNTTQLSEVKELTPEWFTTPDMFRNLNGFQLGQTQDGDMVDDVELPPWAGSPEEFVRINRAALESDFVSAHLHEWIDLIFGYKQRGPDSVEAHNVFYYLTYYGSVNHYMIKDEALRRATELQIAHFGQTPMQLFKVPHPAKKLRTSLSNTGVPRQLRHCFAATATASSTAVTALTSSSTTIIPALLDLSAPDTTSTTPVGSSSKEGGPTPPPPVLAVNRDCDEELIASQAPCTLVQKALSSRVLRAEVLVDRLLCVLDSGVVEVLKYGTSEAAKAALALSAAQPKNKSKDARRGSVITTADVKGASSSSVSSVSADLIILDELYDPFAELQREQELQEAAAAAAAASAPAANSNKESTNGNSSSKSSASETGALEPVVVAPKQLLSKQDYLIGVERELSHFDLIPRVPLVRPYKAHWIEALLRMPAASSLAAAGMAPDKLLVPVTQQTVNSIVFSRSCNLLITAGHVDGRVAVREIDNRTGFIKAAADFTAHRRRVVALSTDAIPSGNTDVMATCDEAGIIMVWTILRSKNDQQLGGVGYVVSRRPQRLFRCDPQPDMFCEISWQMSVVAVASGTKISVFSIERDELIKTFYVDITPAPTPGPAVASTMEHDHVHNPNHRVGCAAAYTSNTGGSPAASTANAVSRRMVLSDFAVVIMHIESFEATTDAFGNNTVACVHSVVATTLSGCRTGLLRCHAPVTYLSCPDRNEYLTLGFSDGTAQICCALSLTVLFSFQPHTSAVECPLLSNTKDTALRNSEIATRDLQASRRRTVAGGEDLGQAAAVNSGTTDSCYRAPVIEVSPVISISLGPNRASPTVVCVMTEAGHLYLKALPDFVRWERVRTPSTLQQLASVPMQAVKGTLMQAQNWTAETAGVLVQNARSLADDALGELRKVRTVITLCSSFNVSAWLVVRIIASSVPAFIFVYALSFIIFLKCTRWLQIKAKGVASFFGLGGGSSSRK